MAHDVFISYSSKDKSTADAICHALEDHGIKCWIAPRDIIGGDKYGNVIESAINNCKVFVLIFSEESSLSAWVNSELSIAFSDNKTIVPFKIDKSAVVGEMRLILNNRHWIEAYPNPEFKFKDLIEAVSLSLGMEKYDAISSSDYINSYNNRLKSKVKTASENKKKQSRIAVLVIAIVVIAIALYLFIIPLVDKSISNKIGGDTKEISQLQSGAFIDKRDGRSYKWIKIGTQIWFAENLAFKTSTGCVAYDNKNENANIYGYLYTWDAAITACPEGWHLPSDEEWKNLEEYLINKGYNYDNTRTGNKYGKALASTIGWSENSVFGNVGNKQSLNNKTGFSAIPCGYKYNKGFYGLGITASWWSSTDYKQKYAWRRSLNYNFPDLRTCYDIKDHYYAVRCIKDQISLSGSE